APRRARGTRRRRWQSGDRDRTDAAKSGWLARAAAACALGTRVRERPPAGSRRDPDALIPKSRHLVGQSAACGKGISRRSAVLARNGGQVPAADSRNVVEIGILAAGT